MNIVFVSRRDLAHPHAGGSEVVVDRLITGLQARGHGVALLCGGPTVRRPYPVVRSGGTYSQFLRAPLASYQVRSPRRWVNQNGVVHDIEPDLVVDVFNGLPFFTPLWYRGPRLCLVHNVAGDQWHQWFAEPIARLGELAERRVMPGVYRDTDILAISSNTQRALEQLGFDEERLHLMHRGVDDDAFETPKAESDEPLFLAMGRLAPNLGFDCLLDLWDLVRPTVGGRLVIAGDGPDRERLAARAGAGVELVGDVDDATRRRLLSEAWLLVHTAHQQGWGEVIMEAAAAGTPTIATDVPGVHDSIIDGVTGALAGTSNDFAAAWTHLATDHARRHVVGQHARTRATEFTWDHTIDAFLKAAAVARDRQPGH